MFGESNFAKFTENETLKKWNGCNKNLGLKFIKNAITDTVALHLSAFS